MQALLVINFIDCLRKQGMKLFSFGKFIAIVLILLTSMSKSASAQTSDAARLGMALDYYQGGKYHEAMLLLEKLDQQYKLNPRFRAYLGVCYYYEWDYARAATCLDSVIPKLESFSPSERSFYSFAAAESYFYMKEFDKALSFYQQMLLLCHDNEKADAFYRIGFIYSLRQDWIAALDNFQSSLVYYRRYRPEETARIAQIRNMIVGCCNEIDAKD